MAKTKVVNQNSLVSEIMTVGGVNKENAVSIFNIFTNAWNTDRIGMLKAVDTGIVVKRTPTRKTVKKAVIVKTKTPSKKKKVVAKKVKSSPVAKVKTKSKGKKKLKTKKARRMLPVATKSTTTNATA